MTIYYIQPSNGGPIKIGYTSKPVEQRIAELQTGCPDKLVLLHTEQGTLDDEAAIHSKFSKHRVNGEWFRPSPELLKHIFYPRREVNIGLLKAHARSYCNCLWSHCVGKGMNDDLVSFLYAHAKYVEDNATYCFDELTKHGIKEICWKHCQHFFAITWPAPEAYMHLSMWIVDRLKDDGWNKELPIKNPLANIRPVNEFVLPQF